MYELLAFLALASCSRAAPMYSDAAAIMIAQVAAATLTHVCWKAPPSTPRSGLTPLRGLAGPGAGVGSASTVATVCCKACNVLIRFSSRSPRLAPRGRASNGGARLQPGPAGGLGQGLIANPTASPDQR